ncbi:reverse transcriptase domain-containing protein [Cytobacillus praedii]|uniref:reverse transcriptase domain-containing protein n=1 Tax=Cytobacillus praedii TaxID=1742358 RepID=UPI003AF456AB
MNRQVDLYNIKYIKTKNKMRKIVTYKEEVTEIKQFHLKIVNFISEKFIPSKFTKAYKKRTSIYHNAIPHMYNDIFISLDIKDFFNSINHKILIDALFYELNLLHKNNVSKLECAKIVSKCTISSKGLPLGLIPSPILSNVYMKEFDNILYGKLKKMGLKNIIYTRYADDMVISFKKEITVEDSVKPIITDIIINETTQLLARYKLKLNLSKTRIIDFQNSNHVKITGVNITKSESNFRKLSVGRKLKNKLFYLAIKCYEEHITTQYEILRVKGLESFILSIEKRGYDDIYSPNMKNKIRELGFESLNQLIKSLHYK